MKKIALIAVLLLFIVGCSSPDDAKDTEDRGSDVKSDKPSASEKLVNFKCTMADVQEYYFYENKIKLVSPSSEGWVIDDQYYVKMEIAGKEYLMTDEAEDPEITAEEMIDMYKTSKATPGFDCTLGGVTEDVVTLPDLEIISNEDLAQLMMQEMTAGME